MPPYRRTTRLPCLPGTQRAPESAILEGLLHPFPDNVTLMEYFHQGLVQGRINPETRALVRTGHEMTFKQFDMLSTYLAIILRNAMGTSLRNCNPDGDFVIGVCVPPSEKLVILLFAIMKLGAAYVPIDTSFSHDRVKRIIDITRPLVVITDTQVTTELKFHHVQAQTKIMSMHALWRGCRLWMRTRPSLLPISELQPLTQPQPESTAIVLFTSGSSGPPKGVRLSHKAVMNRLNWQWHQFPYAPSEVNTFKTSLTFVDSVPEIFGTLFQGKPLLIVPKQIIAQPRLFVQQIKEYKATRVNVVPSFLESILNLFASSETEEGNLIPSLQTVKLWMCSGEALTRDLTLKFFHYFPQGTTLCNFYGSTEIGDVTFYDFHSREQAENHFAAEDSAGSNQVPLGKPVFNTKAYIVDDNLNVISDGEIGQICFAGQNLATGYVGITLSASFIPNAGNNCPGFETLYKTGDHGRIHRCPDGTRVLVNNGREDSQVKVSGQTVDLGEITAAFKSLTEVEEAIALCYHPGQSDQKILAFVVFREGISISKSLYTGKLKLSPSQMPMIRVISKIPRLVNGKTDRQLLLQQYHKEVTRNRT